jgi:hypothetical protein
MGGHVNTSHVIALSGKNGISGIPAMPPNLRGSRKIKIAEITHKIPASLYLRAGGIVLVFQSYLIYLLIFPRRKNFLNRIFIVAALGRPKLTHHSTV